VFVKEGEAVVKAVHQEQYQEELELV